MKFSSLVIAAALSVPAAAEIYFKEQFNDEVGAAEGAIPEENESLRFVSSGMVIALQKTLIPSNHA
jgi:hypothetical protein